jgi:hypothetical protein
LPAPEIQTVNDPADFRVIALESLVEMKLMSNRDKDRTPNARHDRRPANRSIVADEASAGIGGSIEANPRQA